MKKLIALFLALAVLTPAFAMAQTPNLHAEARAEVHASTTKPLTPGSVPKLGPAMRNIASTTRAIGSSTVEMVKARVAAIKEIIEKKHEDMEKRADDARARARARFGEHVEQLVGRISDRLATSSTKLGSIADRIDARIDAFSSQGHDMSGSIALLATARADISAANDKILAVNTALQAAMSTTTPKGQIPAVRAAVKSAEDALKLAKEDLIKTLRSVKVEAGATTTVSH
jgi:hypothetical protein